MSLAQRPVNFAQRLFGAPDATPDPAEVSLSIPLARVFDMLSVERRLVALRYIAREGVGEGVSISLIADHVAAEECGIQPAELSSDQRKRVYVGLYQSHLQRMHRAGLIEYDKDRGVAYATDVTHEVAEFIDVTELMGEDAP